MYALTMERSLIMDYSRVLWFNEDSVIMYRKPDPEDTNMGIFVKVSTTTPTIMFMFLLLTIKWTMMTMTKVMMNISS